MSAIVKFYFYLNLALGLINIHYDSKTQALQLNHWITITLWAVLNTVAVIVQPIIFIVYLKISFYCKEFGPLIIMNGLLTVCHILATLATTLEVWLKRKRFHQLFSNYGILIRRYLRDGKSNENQEATKTARCLVLIKVLSSFCKIAALYIHIYSRINTDECQVMTQNHLIALAIYYGYLNLALIIVDINVTVGLCLIDFITRILMDKLSKIKRDINLLNTAYRNHHHHQSDKQRQIHELWRLKLSRDVDKIAREQTKLRSMTMEHMKLHQCPLLFLLLMVFFSLISLLFHVLIYIAIGNIDKLTLSFYLVVLVAIASNTMTLFNICESIRGNFLKIGYEVYKMRIYASLANGNQFHRDQLELSLECLMMQLRYQEFKISVCGLFEIQSRTGIAMMSSTVLYLIYLIQSVIQIILK